MNWGKQKPENFYQKGISEAQIFIEIENLSLQKLKIDLQHCRCKEKLSPEPSLDSPEEVLFVLKVLHPTFTHLSAIESRSGWCLITAQEHKKSCLSLKVAKVPDAQI